MTDLDFRINGCSISATEPGPFLSEAHAVLTCIARAVEVSDGPPSEETIGAAVRGARTLVEMAGLSWERWCEKPRP